MPGNIVSYCNKARKSLTVERRNRSPVSKGLSAMYCVGLLKSSLVYPAIRHALLSLTPIPVSAPVRLLRQLIGIRLLMIGIFTAHLLVDFVYRIGFIGSLITHGTTAIGLVLVYDHIAAVPVDAEGLGAFIILPDMKMHLLHRYLVLRAVCLQFFDRFGNLIGYPPYMFIRRSAIRTRCELIIKETSAIIAFYIHVPLLPSLCCHTCYATTLFSWIQ